MEDIGSLIFYVLLGILAIVGSLQGKNKKKGTVPKNVVQRKPDPTVTRETAQPAPSPAPLVKPEQKRPQYLFPDPSMEGMYENPATEAFSSEGSVANPLADAFGDEGSIINSMAEAFSDEGSISGSMAEVFSAEGSSAFFDSSIKEFVHNEISDSEIGDAPAYDYNIIPGSEILSEGFNLKKAVIYSVLLNRKEYSY